jgi:hypothetical protein
MRSIALAYERAARYPEAIAAYISYADKYPQDEKAADFVFNAALWKEGLGDDAGAIALWNRYIKAYSTRPDVPRIGFSLALIIQRQKDWKKIADTWAFYQRDYAKSATPGQLFLARYNEAMALQQLKKDDANVPIILAELLRRFPGLPEAERLSPVIDAAAHARFLLLEPAFNEFIAINFNYTRQKDLIFVLKVKNTKMTQLTAAYTDVIKFGSPLYSEAALCRLGEAYANFNHKLLDAPMPRGLTPDQEDLYRTTLENQALPLEDKAVDAFDKAVSTSSRTGVYSEWTLRAQDQLKSYKPDAYGEVKKPQPVGSEALASVTPEGVGGPAAAPAPAAPAGGAVKQAGSGGGAP